MSPVKHGYRLGIELELIVTPKKEGVVIKSLESLGDKIARKYNSICDADDTPYEYPLMENLIDKDLAMEDNSKVPYAKWSIIDDNSLKGYVEGKQWPVEFVSPIFTCAAGDHFRKDMKFLYDTLDAFLHIEVNETCSTHIHLSPADGEPWSLDELKNLARCLLFWEPSLEALYSKSRRNNKWARSNRHDNANLRNKKLAECFDKIRKVTSTDEMLSLMCTNINGNTDRAMAFNFTNLIQPKRATIEWRKGSGSTSYQKALRWVELIVGFTQASRSHGKLDQLKEFERTPKGLHQFIVSGSVPHLIHQDSLDALFSKATTNVEIVPYGHLSEADLHSLKKKSKQEEERRITMRKAEAAPNGGSH